METRKSGDSDARIGGAPPVGLTSLPSSTRNPFSVTSPSAARTPSTFCTLATSDSGTNSGTSWPLPFSEPNVGFGLTTASVPLFAAWKMLSNAPEI